MKHTITVNREIPVIKIAVCGRLRSGKDTAAEHLFLNYGFSRVAFGDALKRNAHAAFPWIPSTPKPRALYQKFGQIMRQEFDEGIWIKHAELSVRAAIDYRVNIIGAEQVGVVITDLRQPNEYEWARANGFSIVRVTAPDDVRIARAIAAGDDFTAHDLAHETELAIDTFDVDAEIINDSSVDDLKAQVDQIIAQM